MLRLVPMSEADFQAYRAYALPDYAQEHVRAGNWPAGEALQLAEKQWAELLPEGPATKGHYLFILQDEATGTEVGILWYMIRERGRGPAAFVCDIQVHEPFRRRGYASQAFRALEERAREEGLTRIGLHVFAHNHPARALYDKLGFVETDLWMAKEIEAEG